MLVLVVTQQQPSYNLTVSQSDLFGHGPERKSPQYDRFVHPVEPPPRGHLLHENIVA